MARKSDVTASIIGLFSVVGIVLLFSIVGVLVLTNSTDRRVSAQGASSSCNYNPSNVVAGNGVMISSKGVSGPIVLTQVSNATTSRPAVFNLNSVLQANGTVVITMPVIAPAGSYKVSAGTSGIVCFPAPGSATPLLAVTLAPLACRADVNRDGVVTSADSQLVFNAFKARSSDRTYDINTDGLVSASDAQLALSATGQKCPSKIVTYSLSQPIMLSDGSWVFKFSPAAGGSLAISISGASLSKPVVISIPSGAASVSWVNNAGAGTYSAYLVDPSALLSVPLSNTVNFTAAGSTNQSSSSAVTPK